MCVFFILPSHGASRSSDISVMRDKLARKQLVAGCPQLSHLQHDKNFTSRKLKASDGETARNAPRGG